MKIVITGHTKGIGKSLERQLDLNGHWVLGFSRSTGHDIGTASGREQILAAMDDADVLVNNAYHATGQFELLKAATEKWKDTTKLIVNINSKAVDADVVLPNMIEYVEAKKKQLEFMAERRLQARPQLLNVVLGLVDTDMASVFAAKKVSPAHIASMLAILIDYKDTIYVQDITLDVPGQNWTDIKGQ